MCGNNKPAHQEFTRQARMSHIANQTGEVLQARGDSSGRSPASKDRSVVRAAQVPPSDRAQEPGLPGGRDGWPDCPLGIAGTRRPCHACIACGAPPGSVRRGRRVTQAGQSAYEHRVRTQRVSVGASGRRGFLHVAGLVELVELRHLLATLT